MRSPACQLRDFRCSECGAASQLAPFLKMQRVQLLSKPERMMTLARVRGCFGHWRGLYDMSLQTGWDVEFCDTYVCTAASLRACLEPACLPQGVSLLPLPTPSRGGPRAAPRQPDNWCLIPRSAPASARHAPLLARLQPRPLSA